MAADSRRAEARTMNEPYCHSLPKDKWCDHSGLGGFMGHTCKAPPLPIREQLVAAIAGEVDHAFKKHGREPWGRHEFYAILLEEVEELWEAIKSDAPQEEVLAELRQVAAMCFRYAETGDRYRGKHPIPARQAPHA